MRIKTFIYILLTAFYWGGFTFYAGLVVPVGMRVLGNHVRMGFITKEVTVYLNFLGVLWVFASNIFFENKSRWVVVAVAFLIVSLFYLHPLQSDSMNCVNLELKPNSNFYTLHRIYLIISTFIWVLVPVHFVMNRKNFTF